MSLLRKILNACQNEVDGIVAYAFLNVCKKFTSLCKVLKEMHTKDNMFLVSASRSDVSCLVMLVISCVLNADSGRYGR